MKLNVYALALAMVAGWTAMASSRIEYIQGVYNAGKTPQGVRILTNFIPNPQTDKIVCEFAFTQRDKTQTIWCARGTQGTTDHSWTLFWIANQQFRFDYKKDYNASYAFPGTFGSSASVGTKYTVTAENNTLTWSGGNGYTYAVDTTFTAAGGPIVLFASYWGGTGNNVDNWGTQKLYSFKIYRNGELIHDLEPVISDSGAATLEDFGTQASSMTLTTEGTITAGPLWKGMSIAAIEDQTFCAEAITPAVSVTGVNEGTSEALTEGEDYTVTYSENFLPGSGIVRVTGLGNYDGLTATATFKIVEPSHSQILMAGDFSRKLVPAGRKISVPNLGATDTDGAALEVGTYVTGITNTTVTGKAYAWAHVTSGEFAGAVAITNFSVAVLPTGYTLLEYVQATGAQYIDSGFTPLSTDAIEMKVRFSEIPKTQALWCGRGENFKNSFTMFLYNNQFRFDHSANGNSGPMVGAPEADVDYTLKADGNTRHININGVDTGVLMEDSTFTAGNHWTFFASHLNMTGFGNYGTYILYEAVAWHKDGSLFLWDVPCKRDSDGAIGLYGTQEEVFHPSHGTGSLVAGPEWVMMKTEGDVPDQYSVGGAACEPKPVVYDRTTGAALKEGTDYTVVYENNNVPGAAKMTVTGIGAYEGEGFTKTFTVVDGGPATPYPNLSRSYVPNGLVGFWDAIDNAGTGTHDATTRTWKDLSRYGHDGVLSDDAYWTNGLAFHNETDGQPCVVTNGMAQLFWYTVTWEFAFQPMEFDVTRTIFSNYRSDTYGMAVKHNNATDFTDGSLLYYTWLKGQTVTCNAKIPSVVKADQLAYFTFQSEVRYLTAWRDTNFVSSVYANSPYCYQTASNPLVIGGSESNPAQAMRGDIRFVRAYNRPLSESERAFNRALDRIRHEHRSFKYELPKTLPDGYYYDAEEDSLSVRIRVNALASAGLVSVNGGAAAKQSELIVPVGSSVTLAYSGDGFVQWDNLPSDVAASSTVSRVTFTAGAPVTASALSATPTATPSTAFSARSYVQKGLLRHFDGIDNTGSGRHNATVKIWTDLCGTGADWKLRNSGAFEACGLTLGGSYDSAYQTTPIPSYLSAEFTARVDSGRVLFMNAEDNTRIFIVRTDGGCFGAQRYDGSRACPYGDGGTTQIVAGVANTYSAVYRDTTKWQCDIDYYLNGQQAPYGRSPASGWTLSTYPALGSRYGENDNPIKGTVFAVRFYDRELAADEIAFNAALDRIRFFGADAATTLANMTLPDGYRWNASSGVLEVRVDVTAEDGTVNVESGTWVAAGTEVTIAFTPTKVGLPARWIEKPRAAELSEDGYAATITAYAPATFRVAAEQALSAFSYVADGLVGLWDAKENAGYGTHNANLWEWHDLTGRQLRPWTLIRGRADFRDDALYIGGNVNSAHPLVQYSLLPDWNTVESYIEPVRTNGASQLLSNRYSSRLFYIDTRFDKKRFGGADGQPTLMGTNANVSAGVKRTYSIVYNDAGTAPESFYLSGEKLPTVSANCSWSCDTDYPALGSRYANCDGRYLGTMHVLRIYNRPLSATEVAFNAAIDRVRYNGERLKDVLPATLPDGYRWNAESEQLEVRVTDADGTVTWYAQGASVMLTYAPADGKGVRAWKGLPAYAELSDNNTKASFAVHSPVTASVETAPETAAYPVSQYLSDGLIASWDGYDASTQTDWQLSGETKSFVNGLAFDGTTFMSNIVSGVKSALTKKALTVQLFLRPRQFGWNGGYLHIGESNARRDLVLNMAGDRNATCKSQRGAFGALQYAAYDSYNLTYSGLTTDTTGYFGQDTLVSIVRDGVGARLALDDGGFTFTNSSYSATPASDQVNIAKWLGDRPGASFDLYAVRIYNRVLSDSECAYNGALDRARFLGEELVLPEGYTNDNGMVKVLVAFSVPNGTGVISVNGAAGKASQSLYLPVGETVRATYTPASGYAFGSWTGAPTSATYEDGRRTLVFTANGLSEITANVLELTESDDNFISSAALPATTAVGDCFAYSFTDAAAGMVSLVTKRDLTLEEAILVGGGGAGGTQNGGGGGGGGLIRLTKPTFIPSGSTFLLKIGAGGAAGTSVGNKGESTIFCGTNFDYEAFGGGGGGGRNSTTPTSGGSIGSGGGRARLNTTGNTAGSHYDPSQGLPGGAGLSTDHYAGGGGGAYEKGNPGDTYLTINGRGGRGFASAMTGELLVYGSGGGAGAGSGTTANVGGPGAGAGGVNSGTAATAGTDGLGGGGGGGAYSGTTSGGAGGAGAVVLRFSEGDTTATQLCVSVSSPAYLFDAAVTPTVSVALSDGTPLAADTDYEVTYLNNAAVGFGGVVVKGKAGTAAEGLTTTGTFEIRKAIFAKFEAAGEADGSTWANAYAPQTALTAARNGYVQGAFADVFFQAGTYPLTGSLTASMPYAIHGGLAGTDGVSFALDETNPETTFDGQGLAAKASSVDQGLVVTAGVAWQTNLITRCGFGRFKLHGFVKYGASSIILRKCRFFNNTWGTANAVTGRGFNITGWADDSIAVLEDCEVSGNGENGASCLDPGNGFGGYFGAFTRIHLDNTLFVTNGWGDGYRSAAGAAFYAENAPVTARNCRFIGNRLVHPETGGTVYLTGKSGGSAFTNCLWLGNCGTWYGGFGNGGKSAPLTINLSDKALTVDVDHCTFAYNLQGSSYTGYSTVRDFMAPAGINVFCGAAKVRNSILWGNCVSSGCTAGSEIFVYSGSVDIDYTLFDGTSTDYIRANGGGEITFGEHIYVGDPHFVTTPALVKKQFAGYATPRSSYGSTSMVYGDRAGCCSFDAHVVSDAANYSLAIDGSDPSAPCANEPMPNGGLANLGFYGNTSGAATSIVGVATLAAADVAVEFPDGLTAPKVTFALGSGNALPYNATVRVLAGASEGTYECSMDFAGVKAGVTNSAAFAYAFTPGTTLYVQVVVSTPGNADVVVAKTATVAGAIPPWYGHGGDSNKVVHVRAGSTAVNPKGTSWTDAYPDIESANGALTATRDEMWVAGTVVRTKTSTGEFTLGAPATIRGGFTGVEDSADDRTNAVYSTLDGSYTCTPLVLFNTYDLTIERMRFTRGTSRAIYRKGCNGNLTLENCLFDNNGATNATELTGACIYFNRGSYDACTLTVNGCRFEGNGRTISSNAKLNGACVYIESSGALYVNDSTFVTNGAPFALTCHGTGAVSPMGTCLYVSSTKARISGCRFIANRSATYSTSLLGGIVRLVGTCNDSVVENCAFVGNECVNRTDSLADAGQAGGAIVVKTSESFRNVYVNNCTFAWNLGAGLTVPADIHASCGVVNARNCIFHGAPACLFATAGTGRNVSASADGTVNVSYSLFDIPITNAVGGVGTVSTANCFTNDPIFVAAPATNLADIVLENAADCPWMHYAGGTERLFLEADVHLVSPAGYWDNAGAFHKDESETRFSPAIDAGDPSEDYANEPAPNGGFLNLGAYGNTTNASMTVSVKPEVDGEISVTFPDDTSFPKVDFTLKKGIIDYSAVVQVSLATNVSGAVTNYLFSSVAVPCRGGEDFSWLCNSVAFAKGSTLYVKVTITSGENVLAKTIEATVTGEMPKWFGKGGGEHILHVWADAPGNQDGSSWCDAYHTFNEAVTAFDENIDEIWIAGDYILSASCKFTPGSTFAIRGGFDACENDPSERKAGTLSRLNAINSYNAIILANATGVSAELDRLVIINSYDRGIWKTGGGDLTIRDSMILTNGIHGSGSSSNGYGKGLRVTSAAGATVTVTNTLFSGNRLTTSAYDQSTGQGNGSAICMYSGKALVVTDCRFYGNGYLLRVPDSSHSENPMSYSFNGGAIYSSVPTTLAYSRFCGNAVVNYSTDGGIVALRGAAKGSVLHHCVFAGNMDVPNGGNGPVSEVAGAVSIALDDASGTVDLVNDTFAFNLGAGKTAAAGLTVKKGAATVRNCIFGNNIIQTTGATDKAADINVRSTGSCQISYSLLSADDTSSHTVQDGGTLEIGDGVSFGDPLFVSPTNSATDVLINNGNQHMVFSSAKGADLVLHDLDVHLLSCAGYFNNAGVELSDVEEGVISQAIDGGDATDAYGNEPYYNGKRINMGAYGNTRYASKSASGEPAFDGEVTVDFPTDITRPRVNFTIGGTGTFVASAVYEIYLNDDEKPTYVSSSINGLLRGRVYSEMVPIVILPTDQIRVKVSLSGGTSGAIVKGESETVKPEGKVLPNWYNHGGDPAKVIHVRSDAFGSGDGSDWENAVVNFHSAMLMLTEERNEIWLYLTNKIETASSTYKHAFPYVVRGGFDGHEDVIGDRLAGVKSTIDGNYATQTLVIANPTNAYFERIVFTHGTGCAFRKAGGVGDLIMVDCEFRDTWRNSSSTAGLGWFTGDSARTATLALTNCIFSGVRYGDYGNCYRAAYFGNFKRVYMDGALFTENGQTITSSSAGAMGVTCFEATSAPLTATGCRFVGNNCSAGGSNGTHVRINGGCGGTVFRNCEWLANVERWITYDGDGGLGGCVYVNGNFEERPRVDFENCTFAYNLCGNKKSAAGITVWRGDVRVKNCIFHDNFVSKENVSAADIWVKYDSQDPEGARCTVSYSLFDELSTNAYNATSVGILDVDEATCRAADPLLMTSSASFLSLLEGATPSWPRSALNRWDIRFKSTAAVRAAAQAMNSHLRSHNGYVDRDTGSIVKTRGALSPAIDAGDPASDFSRERETQSGSHGRRVNLGRWGNTPWSTMSPLAGTFLRLR